MSLAFGDGKLAIQLVIELAQGVFPIKQMLDGLLNSFLLKKLSLKVTYRQLVPIQDGIMLLMGQLR